MKTLVLAFSILIFPQLLFAQPVIEGYYMAPIGFAANISVGPAVTPGPEGADQIWDFSTTALTLVGTYEIVDPATTPFVTMVPFSNFCTRVVPIAKDTSYDYYNLQATKMEKVAQGMTNSGGDIFTDYKTDMIFPFSYQQAYTDTFTKAGGSTGIFTKTYDAYGTLFTADKKYTNVVRVHTVWDNGDWLYEWLDSEMIFTIWAVNADGSKSLFNTNTGINNAGPDAVNVSVSPSPASSYCHINGIDQKIEGVDLINLTGQTVKTFEGDMHGFDVTGMLPGLYAVRIRLESGKLITKKITVR
jgi:hypothetical protein